jgi:hypothetical protein
MRGLSGSAGRTLRSCIAIATSTATRPSQPGVFFLMRWCRALAFKKMLTRFEAQSSLRSNNQRSRIWEFHRARQVDQRTRKCRVRHRVTK